MSNGGTVEELDAQVKALEDAKELHWDAAQDAERRALVDLTDPTWQDTAAVHRVIVEEYTDEIQVLRAEMALLPRQRPPATGS